MGRAIVFVHFFFVACIAQAATVNIPTDYRTIQEGIDAAADGDKVLVAAGEYWIRSPVNFNGKAITVASETGAEETAILMSGNPTNRERASVVIFESGETETSVLDGFTLRGGAGTAWGSYSHENGGGGLLCINGSSPKVANCVIKANYTDQVNPVGWNPHYGGGVYCHESSPALTNCTITENDAEEEGGGVFCYGSPAPSLTGCTITGNTTKHGGGLSCTNSSPSLNNCTIAGNKALFGGGVHCKENSSPALSDCTVTGNIAEAGGAVYCIESSPVLVDSILWGNGGGAVYICKESWCEESHPVISFCCIEGEEVWLGEGNMNKDPLFCGWAEGEVQVSNQDEFEDALTGFSLALSQQSPCLGSGKEGGDIGAETGICPDYGNGTKLILLSEGVYNIEGLSLVYDVSIEGAGEEKTVLKGTVRGLRTGAKLSNFTITQGTEGGVRIVSGEAPRISNCTISENTGQGGAGVCCFGSYPMFTDCTITENSAVYDGGGFYCVEEAAPALLNCRIKSNIAEDGGGGFCCFSSSPEIRDCIISRNVANGGAGFCCCDSSPLIEDCTITRNDADSNGGGISCGGNSSLELKDCTISENKADEGGGFDCKDSSVQLSNCTVLGNMADSGGGIDGSGQSFIELINCTVTLNRAVSGHGGGIRGYKNNIKLANCMITGNSSVESGAGVSLAMGSAALTNYTITENSTEEDYGGGISCYNSYPVVTNCIVWRNVGGSIYIEGEGEGAPAPNISFSCIQSDDLLKLTNFGLVMIGDEVWPGQANIDENPLLVKEGTYDFERSKEIEIGEGTRQMPDVLIKPGDFHLQEGSPCIDAGDSGDVAETDIDGNTRVFGESVDMGVYEFTPRSGGIVFIRGDANADNGLDVGDPVLILHYLFAGEEAPCCLDAADVDDDGRVNITDATVLLGYLFSGGPPPLSPYPDWGVVLCFRRNWTFPLRQLGCRLPRGGGHAEKSQQVFCIGEGSDLTAAFA